MISREFRDVEGGLRVRDSYLHDSTSETLVKTPVHVSQNLKHIEAFPFVNKLFIIYQYFFVHCGGRG